MPDSTSMIPPTASPSPPNLWRPIAATMLGGCFLCFVAGAFVSEFQIFPYHLIFENPFAYLHARNERHEMELDADTEGHEALASASGRVTLSKPGALDGYTFLTYDIGRPSTARLLDMQGNVLHEWHKSFREIWPHPPHKDNPSPETAIAWRYGQLFSNGDIIATIISYGDTPYGYGLVKLDKDSNVIWAVPDNFHHQFSIDGDGNIFGLTHQWRDTRENRVNGDSHLPKHVLEDFVAEVTPDGKEIAKVSLIDALTTSGYAELLDSSYTSDFKAKAWDIIHANDVEVIDAGFASHYSFIKPGMLLISLRDLDALVVLDMSSKKIIWAMRGAWVRQHDPDLLPDGNVLLFDNRGDNIKGGGSRVIEFNPASGRVSWSYAGTPEQPFRSDKSGAVQRLSNGDTLISEDDSGRVFEVNQHDQIVWDFHDVRLHQATRVAKDWLRFTPSGLKKENSVTTQP